MQFHASCNVIVRAPSSCKLLPKPPCLSWTIYDDRWPSMSTKHIHIKYPPEFGRNFADRSLHFDAPKSKNVNGSGNVVSPLQPEKKTDAGNSGTESKTSPSKCMHLATVAVAPEKASWISSSSGSLHHSAPGHVAGKRCQEAVVQVKMKSRNWCYEISLCEKT